MFSQCFDGTVAHHDVGDRGRERDDARQQECRQEGAGGLDQKPGNQWCQRTAERTADILNRFQRGDRVRRSDHGGERPAAAGRHVGGEQAGRHQAEGEIDVAGQRSQQGEPAGRGQAPDDRDAAGPDGIIPRAREPVGNQATRNRAQESRAERQRGPGSGAGDIEMALALEVPSQVA